MSKNDVPELELGAAMVLILFFYILSTVLTPRPHLSVGVGVRGTMTVYYTIDTNKTDVIVGAVAEIYNRLPELYSLQKQAHHFENTTGIYLALNITFIVINNTLTGQSAQYNYTFIASSFIIKVSGVINRNITVPAQVGTYHFYLEGKL